MGSFQRHNSHTLFEVVNYIWRVSECEFLLFSRRNLYNLHVSPFVLEVYKLLLV